MAGVAAKAAAESSLVAVLEEAAERDVGRVAVAAQVTWRLGRSSPAQSQHGRWSKMNAQYTMHAPHSIGNPSLRPLCCAHCST